MFCASTSKSRARGQVRQPDDQDGASPVLDDLQGLRVDVGDRLHGLPASDQSGALAAEDVETFRREREDE